MELSDLITELFKASEYRTPNSLASTTGQTQPFTDAFVAGTKKSRIGENILFEALTKDISVEVLLSAIDLIRKVRESQIEREQFI